MTDSAIVAAQADGVVLVYQAGKVGRLVLKRAKAHLESARAAVLGVVLNDVQSEIAGYTYAHYYTHYYGEEPGTGAAPGRLGRLWQSVTAWRARRTDPLPMSLPHDEETHVAGAGPERRRRRYRDIFLGLGVVALLGAAIVLITAWHLGLIARGERPRSLERRLSDTPSRSDRTPAPASPSSPAAPVQSRDSAAAVAAGGVAPAPSVVSPAPIAPPPTGAEARETPTSDAPRETAGKETAAVAAGPRFAVEFGPFLTGTEAEKTERQLNQAGHQTVRFRQQTGAALYAVLIERVAGAREAEAIVTTLRDQGFPEAAGFGGGDSITVRVGEPMLLRAAVELAEGLRAKGHQVRVAAQSGEAQTFVIRHGNFASRGEAEARAAELGRLGLVNHVVRAK